MPVHAETGGGRRGTLAKVSLSSVSAAMAEASTYPLDAVKTRLQLRRSPGGASGGGVLRVATELARDGGVYRGFSPAVLRHLMYTPLRIVGYEHLRSTLASGGREVSVVEKALAGGLSGIAAQVIFFLGKLYVSVRSISNKTNNSQKVPYTWYRKASFFMHYKYLILRVICR